MIKFTDELQRLQTPSKRIIDLPLNLFTIQSYILKDESSFNKNLIATVKSNS